MEIANKVIDDRIAILEDFLEKTKESTEPGIQMNRGDALRAKGLFSQLKLAIEEHTNLLNGGTNNEDLVNKIKELTETTVVQLIDRNKKMIDSYNQAIHNLRQRGDNIKNLTDLSSDVKAGLNNIEGAISQREQTKSEIINYLKEYEVAMEEIEAFVLRVPEEIKEETKTEAEITQPAPAPPSRREIIEDIIEDEEDFSTGLGPKNYDKPESEEKNGEFPV